MASIPASALSATSVRTSVSTIRCSATTPIVASRLEGQTKTYLVDIIIGERTAEQAPQFALLELDLIQVVGKTKPVRIFFLFGDESVAATEAFAVAAPSPMAR